MMLFLFTAIIYSNCSGPAFYENLASFCYILFIKLPNLTQAKHLPMPRINPCIISKRIQYHPYTLFEIIFIPPMPLLNKWLGVFQYRIAAEHQIVEKNDVAARCMSWNLDETNLVLLPD